MNVFTNGDNTLQHDEELIPCSKESTPKVARTVPRVNFLGTEVFARSQPLLRWGEKDNRGITSSGWNPLNGASVCFSDKSASDGEINIIIEPPAPGFALSVAAVICVPYWPLLFKAISTRAVAHGYFFKKNAESGRIDMIHRCKPFRGKEERKLYKDCTHFGISIEKCRDTNGDLIEGSTFTLTSGYSDKHFPTGINFSPSTCEDLLVIVRAVNDLIRSVQGDIDVQQNSRVYPLFCTAAEYERQCLDYEKSLIYDDDFANELALRCAADGISDAIYLDASAIAICSADKGTDASRHEVVTAAIVYTPIVVVTATV